MMNIENNLIKYYQTSDPIECETQELYQSDFVKVHTLCCANEFFLEEMFYIYKPEFHFILSHKPVRMPNLPPNCILGASFASKTKLIRTFEEMQNLYENHLPKPCWTIVEIIRNIFQEKIDLCIASLPPGIITIENLEERLYTTQEQISSMFLQNQIAASEEQKRQLDHAAFTCLLKSLESSSLSKNQLRKAFEFRNKKCPEKILDFSEFYTYGDKEISTAGACGLRDRMEDRCFCYNVEYSVEQQIHSATVIGVCDGHTEIYAADFVKKYMGKFLRENLEKFCQKEKTEITLTNALKQTCVQLHRAFIELKQSGGTTLSAVIFFDCDIWCLNVGDSRIMSSYKGFAQQVTDDARCSTEKYKFGIIKRNGFIVQGYGNGRLEPARTIGDLMLQLPGTKAISMSSRPKICTIRHADYIIIATDGLTDVATTNQIMKMVNLLDQKKKNPLEIANHLVLSAILCGSQDNISVAVIKLNPSKLI